MPQYIMCVRYCHTLGRGPECLMATRDDLMTVSQYKIEADTVPARHVSGVLILSAPRHWSLLQMRHYARTVSGHPSHIAHAQLSRAHRPPSAATSTRCPAESGISASSRSLVGRAARVCRGQCLSTPKLRKIDRPYGSAQ
eukprot:296492-Prymnesium_polylepis.1